MPQRLSDAPFLITGFPRSRTAWFSMLTGAVHEPFPSPSTWEGGVSDSSLGLHLPLFLQTLQPRTLIVWRQKDEVMKSLRDYLRPVPMDWRWVSERLDILAETYQAIGDHPLVKSVDFHDLDDIAIVRACLDHLHVAEPPNLEQLIHFRVESRLDYNLKRLARAREAA